MAAPTPFEPPVDFRDPRQSPAFRPELWPRCNGGDCPGLARADLHERRCIEFLTAYYRVNVAQADLAWARETGEPKVVVELFTRRLGEASQALDALEDRYSPIGFFGDPVMDGLYYKDIEFVRPELPQVISAPSSYSAHIRIPGLEDLPPGALEGTPRVFRRAHGKVDL